MSDDHNNTENLEDSAIYRLRWVTDAMEAAKRYAEDHPEEVQTLDGGLVDAAD